MLCIAWLLLCSALYDLYCTLYHLTVTVLWFVRLSSCSVLFNSHCTLYCLSVLYSVLFDSHCALYYLTVTVLRIAWLSLNHSHCTVWLLLLLLWLSSPSSLFCVLYDSQCTFTLCRFVSQSLWSILYDSQYNLLLYVVLYPSDHTVYCISVSILFYRMLYCTTVIILCIVS